MSAQLSALHSAGRPFVERLGKRGRIYQTPVHIVLDTPSVAGPRRDPAYPCRCDPSGYSPQCRFRFLSTPKNNGTGRGRQDKQQTL